MTSDPVISIQIEYIWWKFEFFWQFPMTIHNWYFFLIYNWYIMHQYLKKYLQQHTPGYFHQYSFSLSFHLIFDLLTFSSNNIFVHILFAPHWWFWGILNCMKSLMISFPLFSLLKHVFMGHEIEVCTPMWFNQLLSPSSWSSNYFSSNNISVT